LYVLFYQYSVPQKKKKQYFVLGTSGPESCFHGLLEYLSTFQSFNDGRLVTLVPE